MPEGHVVERVAREHTERFRGQRLRVSSPQGRFVEGAALLDGHMLLGVSALGKHSLHRFAADGDARSRNDLYLHVHLGLYGKWSGASLPVPDPVGAIRVQLVGDDGWAQLRGATACEVITAAEVRDLRARLGEDPLHSKEGGAKAYSRLSGSSRAIAVALMDQTVTAGVGNAYRAEILFRHGLWPFTPSSQISPELWSQLWTDLQRLMRAGVREGRMVTTDRADRTRRSGPAREDDQYYVYRRAGLPCRRCGTPIAVQELAGRNLFWCPSCQAA